MHLRIQADQLMIYAKDESAFVRLAKQFEDESKTGMNKAEPVYAARHISDILDGYLYLSQINFYTHGHIGYVHLPGGGIVTRTAPFLLDAPHPQLFRGEGRILFMGCNVGEGPEGRDFMIAAGKALLDGHGGFVGATTSKNVFGRWGLFDIRKPLWGDLRVIQFDARGKVVAEKLF